MPRASKTGVSGLRKEAGRWVLDFRGRGPDGRAVRHKRRFAPGVKKPAARAYAEAIANAVAKGEPIRPEYSEGPKLHSAMGVYLDDQAAKGLRSIESKRSVFRVLKGATPDVPLADFNVDDLRDLADARRKEGVSPATINRGVGALLHFLKWARRRGWYPVDRLAAVEDAARTEDVRGREPKERVRALNTEERGRLIKAIAESPIRLPVLFMLHTGVRRGNALGLRWSWVDEAARVVVIPPGEAKSGRAVRVPLNADALQVLQEARQADGDGEHVFCSSHGRPWTGDGFSASWKRARARAGLVDFRLHDLRHTFATDLRRRGVGLDVISKVLGHAGVQVSSRYAHVADAMLHEAVDSIASGG